MPVNYMNPGMGLPGLPFEMLCRSPSIRSTGGPPEPCLCKDRSAAQGGGTIQATMTGQELSSGEDMLQVLLGTGDMAFNGSSKRDGRSDSYVKGDAVKEVGLPVGYVNKTEKWGAGGKNVKGPTGQMVTLMSLWIGDFAIPWEQLHCPILQMKENPPTQRLGSLSNGHPPELINDSVTDKTIVGQITIFLHPSRHGYSCLPRTSSSSILPTPEQLIYCEEFNHASPSQSHPCPLSSTSYHNPPPCCDIPPPILANKPAETTSASTMDLNDDDFLNKFLTPPLNRSTPENAKPLASSSAENARDYSRCLLLTVVTARNVNYQDLGMQLNKAWRLQSPATFSQSGNNLFLAEFSSLRDLNLVVEGGPWSYRFDLVAVKRITDHLDIHHQSITHAEVWVQAHSKYPDLVSQQDLLELITEVGQPVSIPQPVIMSGTKHFRVKLTIPIDEPIHDRLYISHPLVGSFEICLVYEKIKGLCNFCGLLGHEYSSCVDWARYCRLALSPKYKEQFGNRLHSPYRFGPWMTDASVLSGYLNGPPRAQQTEAPSSSAGTAHNSGLGFTVGSGQTTKADLSPSHRPSFRASNQTAPHGSRTPKVQTEVPPPPPSGVQLQHVSQTATQLDSLSLQLHLPEHNVLKRPRAGPEPPKSPK